MTNVGSLESNSFGDGARSNSSKTPLEHLPFSVLVSLFFEEPYEDDGGIRTALRNIMLHMSDFEDAGVLMETDYYEQFLFLKKAINEIMDSIEGACNVFAFGEKKYKKYNWMKGMKYSIPMASIKRHALAILSGEHIDPESKLKHIHHIACNIIMLMYYFKKLPSSLDDRPIVTNS